MSLKILTFLVIEEKRLERTMEKKALKIKRDRLIMVVLTILTIDFQTN